MTVIGDNIIMTIIGAKHSDSGRDTDPVIVHDRKVACSGPPSPHDHPVVYYYIMQPGGDGAAAVVDGEDNTVICMYCDKKYIYQDSVSGMINGRSFQENNK